ncbi:hypothetical protein T07_4609 [Trichinella nelsoni]|uniref:Uncharacterized protein n=1 Tax=Trichinella nelsoni TaxID=6336 RepID=A0A0V0RK95_9BILA|nr:hypothetical protein T07_4609 [Trichinella nelsoni]
MEKETYTIEKKTELSTVSQAGRWKNNGKFAKSTLVSYCTSGDAAIALLSSAAFATRSTPIQPVSPAQIQPALVDPAFVYR